LGRGLRFWEKLSLKWLIWEVNKLVQVQTFGKPDDFKQNFDWAIQRHVLYKVKTSLQYEIF
jgi:hypothetical protein